MPVWKCGRNVQITRNVPAVLNVKVNVDDPPGE